MGQSFAELFEESQVEQSMRTGAILMGVVVEVGADYVLINAGLKSESFCAY